MSYSGMSLPIRTSRLYGVARLAHKTLIGWRDGGGDARRSRRAGNVNLSFVGDRQGI